MVGYEYWRAKLDGLPVEHSDNPELGFWRRRPHRGAAWRPLAIFIRDGEITCLDGGVIRPWHQVWSPFVQAIEEAAYRDAIAAGRFPDDYDTHRHAPTAHSLTTELSNANPVLPIVRTS